MNEKTIKNGNNSKNGGRDSGIELFRIITMLVIVSHHYVVNSGVSEAIFKSSSLSTNSIFLLLFGWGGKTGINCFVLITGYFMCRSNITVRKFLKLLLWMYFYKILLSVIFAATGYHDYGIKEIIKIILPVTSIADGFGSAYLIFYLFIPFLNILISGLNKNQHLLLIILCVVVYTVFAAINLKVVFNYVTWFSVLYIIGSYLRLHPEKWFDSKKIWGFATLMSLIISWLSVIVIASATLYFMGEMKYIYYFVSDSNKPLALITAVCAFMFFKNMNIGYHKVINKIAASAYGVLLIHANSDVMRQWLWKDTLNNVGYMKTSMVYIHAFASVIGIYIICTLIDMVRIKLFEQPFFRWYDKAVAKHKRLKQ